jgi:hypothetical protein
MPIVDSTHLGGYRFIFPDEDDVDELPLDTEPLDLDSLESETIFND